MSVRAANPPHTPHVTVFKLFYRCSQTTISATLDKQLGSCCCERAQFSRDPTNRPLRRVMVEIRSRREWSSARAVARRQSGERVEEHSGVALLLPLLQPLLLLLPLLLFASGFPTFLEAMPVFPQHPPTGDYKYLRSSLLFRRSAAHVQCTPPPSPLH